MLDAVAQDRARASAQPQGESMQPSGSTRARYARFKARWLTLGFYERFEDGVAMLMAWLMAAVVLVATWRVVVEVGSLLGVGFSSPVDHKVFQRVFGEIATVLIALEFRHSITGVVPGRAHIIEVQTVLLVALLALARKFIILDPQEHDAAQLLALGAVIVALSVAYWVVRDREARQDAQPSHPRGTPPGRAEPEPTNHWR